MGVSRVLVCKQFSNLAGLPPFKSNKYYMKNKNVVYQKSTDRPRGPAVPISKKAEQIKIKVMPFFVPDLEALLFSAFQMVSRETFPRGPPRGVLVESRLEIPTRPTELLPLQCKTRT